ncbi:MAG: NADH-quinone oxidoreductase subunit C [Candidatus Acidiferrum sp.]
MTDSSSQNANVVAAQDAAVERLRAWNPDAIAEVAHFRNETTIVIPRELLRRAAEICRDDASLQFDLLTDATCVDRTPSEPRFELNYHLVSIPLKQKVRLRTRVLGSDAVVDSLVPVWPGAGWLEREIFDLFGVRFAGHPDLRRILLPDDFAGYPLRRDYAVQGYRDIPPPPPGFKKDSV